MQEPALGTLSACLSDCLSDPASERYPHAMDTVAACLDSFPLGACGCVPLRPSC